MEPMPDEQAVTPRMTVVFWPPSARNSTSTAGQKPHSTLFG
jgi:hypothetical protein